MSDPWITPSPFAASPDCWLRAFVGLRWIVGLLIGFACGFATAGDEGDTPPAAAPPAEKPKGAENQTFRRQADGSFAPVKRAEVLEILGPLEPEDPHPKTPPLHFSRVVLDGVAGEDRVDFQGQFEIQIRDEGVWQDVPLRLHQAHVTGKRYTGSGEEGPAIGGNRDDGLIWKIRGAGTHQLTLEFWTPLKKSAAGRQLQLFLPHLPSIFEASVNLKLPGEAWTIRSAKEVSWDASVEADPAAASGKQTRIKATVGSSRLDLSWQPRVDEKPAYRVSSQWRIRRNANRLQHIVNQVIAPLVGSPQELLVELPAGHLTEVTGTKYSVGGAPANREFALVASHEPVADRPGWVRVRLTEAMADPIELRWVVSEELTPGSKILCHGFQVAGERRHDGKIFVEDLNGLAAHWSEERSRFVDRCDLNDAHAVAAFEFFQQPFQAAFDLETVAPRYTVVPRYYLYVASDHLDLKAVFQVEMESWIPDSIEVDWPGRSSEMWTVESLVGPKAATLETAPVSPKPRAEPLRLPIPAGTARTVDVVVKGRCPFDPASPLAISLPVLRGTRVAPGRLELACDDPIDPRLQPSDGTPLERIEAEKPPSLSVAPITNWQIGGVQPQFVVSAEVRPRTLEAESRLTVHPVFPARIDVTQQIRGIVRYGRVSSLRLAVPESLTSRVPLKAASEWIKAYEEGTKLPVEGTDGGDLRIDLIKPRIGLFDIDLHYSLPLPAPQGDGSIHSEVPILNLTEGPWTRLFCDFPTTSGVQVIANGDAWEKLPSSDQEIWFAAHPQVRVPLRLSSALADVQQNYQISLAHLHTRVEHSGKPETTAEYQFFKPPAQITLDLPEDCDDASLVCHYNDELLDASRLVRKGRRLTIELSRERLEETASPATFRLSYSHDSFPLRVVGQCRLQFPRFPQQVSVLKTMWELELPSRQHLFTLPAELTPGFAWQRLGMFWSRLPTEEFRQLRAQMRTDGIGSDASYPFTTSSAITEVSFCWMSGSLIVLLGTGLTLMIGYAIWRFPRCRNIQSLTIGMVLVSIAGVWALDEIELLLQPALLGLALALLATWIDARTRSKSRGIDYDLRTPPRARSTSDASAPVPDGLRSTVFRPMTPD